MRAGSGLTNDRASRTARSKATPDAKAKMACRTVFNFHRTLVADTLCASIHTRATNNFIPIEIKVMKLPDMVAVYSNCNNEFLAVLQDFRFVSLVHSDYIPGSRLTTVLRPCALAVV